MRNPSWRYLFRLAFWLGVAGLTVVSLTPGEALPSLHGLDVLYHGLAYAGLSCLAAAGHPGERQAALAIAGLVGLGVVLEFAQELVPGRSGSLADALANTFGACVVALFWWKRLRGRPANRSKP